MRTLLSVVIAAGVCGWFAAYIHAWYGNREQGKTRLQATVFAVFDAFAILRDAAFRLAGWLFGHAKRNAPRAARRARIHARNGRAAVNRRRADRRRPIGADGRPIPEGERHGTIGDPDVQRAMAQGGRIVPPQPRAVVTPLRQEPDDADPPWTLPGGPAPYRAAGNPGPAAPGPAPAGAIHPVFAALISWILDQEHPDSVDFEEFHRQLSSGFLAAGEAMHEYTEHLAEGGIGLDPIIVQAAAEAAEATNELSAGIVDIFRKFHAIYAGYLAWLEDGHQNTHDGRWIRPESA